MQTIGLLFVHGIGEQDRFEHLSSSVREFAELIRTNLPHTRVSVVDRTRDWPLQPGQPDIASRAPITLSVQPKDGMETRFECHEVWWADLGTRSSLAETARFWLWGLGQWGAAIYQELDFSRTRNDHKPIVVMPVSAAGRIVVETLSRLFLMLAACAALLTLLTWSLAKRLFQAVFDKAPSPTLLVQYIGDVRTYERRSTPGEAPVSDPGHPLRVGIRRRMVTEMVAMAARDLDGWFVVAHSLGTVLAYNGLTEIGHALPNYLPEPLWRSLPDEWKRDSDCRRREDISAMMPSRPPWLDDADVINRPLLFASLKGVLTYGSPLDKFAALWPRIVATASDRTDRASAFPTGCRWINLAAPHDPVAGRLDRFSWKSTLAPYLPPLEDYATPLDPFFGFAHVRYFRSGERAGRGKATRIKVAAMRWLLGEREVAISGARTWLRRPVVFLGYAAIFVLLALLATVLVTFGRGIVSSLFGAGARATFTSWSGFARDYRQNLGPTTGFVVSAVAGCGLARWVGDGWLNARMGWGDIQRSRVRALLTAQAVVGTLFALVLLPAMLAAMARDVYPAWWPVLSSCPLVPDQLARIPAGWSAVAVSTAAVIAAAFLQALINRAVR